MILKTKMDQSKLKFFEEDGIDTSISVAMLKADFELPVASFHLAFFEFYRRNFSQSEPIEGQTSFEAGGDTVNNMVAGKDITST